MRIVSMRMSFMSMTTTMMRAWSLALIMIHILALSSIVLALSAVLQIQYPTVWQLEGSLLIAALLGILSGIAYYMEDTEDQRASEVIR